MTFETRDVTVTYARAARPALADISFDIERGHFVAIIGPNGSGKSTLVRALLGAVRLDRGVVKYDDRALADWPRIELARRIGVVTQIEEMPFPVTVRELVAMGRYPHLGALRAEGATDRAAIDQAMQRAHIEELAGRSIATLSGGERQRARIARALAQTPETLVLDEPTTALDIAHEMAVFELVRSLAHDEGRTVVVATHNINLAARYADTMLLLAGGRLACAGPPRSVMKQDVLQSVYGWPVSLHEHAGPGFDTGAPQVAPLSHHRGTS